MISLERLKTKLSNFAGRIHQVLGFRWQITPLMGVVRVTWPVFRWTLRQSRPNKAGLKCPSICTYICPATKIFFNFNEIWHVGRARFDESCTKVCSMTRSKVKSTISSNLEIRSFQTLSPPLFTMGTGNWPLFLKQGHNI